MLTEMLKDIVDKERQKGTRQGYIINLLKEYLQNMVLELFYGNKLTNDTLIFTGGTCLRFCFDLPRLSEDLDFDTASDMDNREVGIIARDYFEKSLKYKDIDMSIKGKEKKIYLKFPLLKDMGLKYGASDILLLKIEIAKAQMAASTIETSMVERSGRTYFLKRYSLSDLMSGKINAFLTRLYFKGKKNEIEFKGRDLFDLVWYMGKGVVPNKLSLKLKLKGTKYENMTWNQILDEISQKALKIKKSHIIHDIENFIESSPMLDNFINNYEKVIEQYSKAARSS